MLESTVLMLLCCSITCDITGIGQEEDFSSAVIEGEMELYPVFTSINWLGGTARKKIEFFSSANRHDRVDGVRPSHSRSQ
jgi:hypothetical protein